MIQLNLGCSASQEHDFAESGETVEPEPQPQSPEPSPR